MREFLSLTIFLLCWLQCFSKRYTYLTYSDILDKMKDLSFRHSRYCKLTDVKLEYDYLIDTKCGKSPCEHWYLQITDFSVPQEKINVLPQILFIGGIHGDEALGPNILINLAEYLLQKNEEDEDITKLIKSRFILILPMANPSGFYLNRREERQETETGAVIYIDPNKDFPYNNPDGKCLATSTARVINSLFKRYLIQATITFHGGSQSITYPWGASNHQKKNDILKAEECPDDKAFSDIAQILSQEAGNNTFLSIDSYIFGRTAELVRFTNGSMEDWSYAASWESNVVSKCEGSSQGPTLPPSETIYNSNSARTLVFLVETSANKAPTSVYLGATDGLEGSKDKYAYGYIPINIRLSIALIDLVEPYVILRTLYFSDEDKTITIEWQGGGCKSVDSTHVEWQNKEDNLVFSNSLKLKQGPGYYTNKTSIFKEVIQLNNTKFNFSFQILMICDQVWTNQIDPKPNVKPQTHVVQARTNQSYSIESNGYKITGKNIVELRIEDINLDSLMKTRIKNVKDLNLVMEFTECSAKNNLGVITAQIFDDGNSFSLHFLGKLSVEDPFLEGYLHEYGDISRCQTSIGNRISTINVNSEENAENGLLFKMEKDEIKTVKVDYRMKLSKDHNILNFIGRSVFLERNGHPDKSFVAQILPYQPSSCRKINEMKNCLGVSLGDNLGVCTIQISFEESIHDLKLFIKSESDEKNIRISGLASNEIVDHYYKFDEIYLINEKVEKKFTIKKNIVHGYGVVEEKTFNLYPDIALGNLLKIYIQAFGDRVFLGDCSIVLADSKFNETQFLIESYNKQTHENASQIRKNMLYFLGVCSMLVIGGVTMTLLIRRYKKVKQQTFEVAMSTRRERYADTARMIGSARSDNPLGSGRGGFSSARLGLNLGLKESARSDKPQVLKVISKSHRRHMELEEMGDFEDEAS